MALSTDRPSVNPVRVAVNSPLGHAVATVAALSALGGFAAGGVAALIAVGMLTPSEPVTARDVVLMAVESGFVASLGGAALGVLTGFAALRRVPIGRLVLLTSTGLAAGLTWGWVGGPWAWHHMGMLGFAGFTSGAVLARLLSLGTRGTARVSAGVPRSLESGGGIETPVQAQAAPVSRTTA